MEDKKKYIFWGGIGAVFIVLYIIMAIFIGNHEFGVTDNYLLVDNYLLWHEKGGKWYQETDVNNNLMKQKFTVLTGEDKYTAYKVQYVDSSWYFFDKNYNELDNDFRIAYSGDLKLNLTNYEVEYYESSDDVFIKKVAKPESKSQFEAYRQSVNKVTYDIDNDGTLETLYTINSFSFDVKSYDFDSYMFIVKNDKIVSKIKSSKTFSLIEILDLDNDSNNEIIVLIGNTDNPTLEDCYNIYKIKDNKLSLYQKCLFNE